VVVEVLVDLEVLVQDQVVQVVVELVEDQVVLVVLVHPIQVLVAEVMVMQELEELAVQE
jgi:hypothetical protein